MADQGMGRRPLPSGVDPDVFPARVRRLYGWGRGHVAGAKRALHKGERQRGRRAASSW